MLRWVKNVLGEIDGWTDGYVSYNEKYDRNFWSLPRQRFILGVVLFGLLVFSDALLLLLLCNVS